MEFIPAFERFELAQILHSENAHADILSKLASSKDFEPLMMVPIKHLPKPSTFKCKEAMWVEDTLLWMKPIIGYLRDQALPSKKEEA